ncbi:MAG: redoxin domain-containing protein [Chlorobi bacterium]|nr:redoxin domain-containing protein [Chlorobiota bacterium]MCI0715183.1 redoxin domain-containing protein [Chlorobiota bacterium]
MLKKPIFLLFSALLIISFITYNNSFAKGPGDKADDFSLVSTDGVKFNLTEALYNSKNGVIVMFWSTTCPNVQPYNDRINDFANHYIEKGFTVWAINSNSTESLEEVASHSKKNNYSFPMLKDDNNVVADMFGATRTPEVYMIGKDRTILYHGRISNSKDKSDETSLDLKNAVEEAAGGKEISMKETKFFGCTIKRAGQDN